jgi:hypothetical protein
MTFFTCLRNRISASVAAGISIFFNAARLTPPCSQ